MNYPFSKDFLRVDVLSLVTTISSVIEQNIELVDLNDLTSLLRCKSKLADAVSLPHLNENEVLAIAFCMRAIDKFFDRYFAYINK